MLRGGGAVRRWAWGTAHKHSCRLKRRCVERPKGEQKRTVATRPLLSLQAVPRSETSRPRGRFDVGQAKVCLPGRLHCTLSERGLSRTLNEERLCRRGEPDRMDQRQQSRPIEGVIQCGKASQRACCSSFQRFCARYKDR